MFSCRQLSVQLQLSATLMLYLNYDRPELPKMLNIWNSFRIRECPYVVDGDDNEILFTNWSHNNLKLTETTSLPHAIQNKCDILCAGQCFKILFFLNCAVTLNPKSIILGFVKTRIYWIHSYIHSGAIVLIPWTSSSVVGCQHVSAVANQQMVLLVFGTGFVCFISGSRLVLLGIRNWFVGTEYLLILEEPVFNSVHSQLYCPFPRHNPTSVWSSLHWDL